MNRLTLLHRWWCNFWVRHTWQKISLGKRYCVKCGREQWLFSRAYPAVYEAKFVWQDMGFITPAGRAALAQEGGRDGE